MSTTTINLKLETVSGELQLQWNDNGVWKKVMPNSPSTPLDEGDEIDWVADGSIDGLKIKFKKGNIIPDSNITGNDGKSPKGKTKSGLSGTLSDSYTIKVKPTGQGGFKEYDPEVKYPAS